MKFRNSAIYIAILTTILITSCSKNNEEVKIKKVTYKKVKKDPSKRHKKGIEHMADYYKEISTPIGETKSSYEPGYIYKEYNKFR